MSQRVESWGRYPRSSPARVSLLRDRAVDLPPSDEPLLVFGNGRSYGDSCLLEGGHLLLGRGLDRFLSFDTERGILRAEAGVLLSEVLELVVPRGWFLPVTPGTRFVTLGGAVANDVHGKDHHRAGTFGCHVRNFELVRSDGSRRFCSPFNNPDWFAATIGGMGLTGWLTWVEIQLRPIQGPWIEAEDMPFRSLEEFFDLSEKADKDHEFTVAWVDCAARGNRLGRGIFTSGDFSRDASAVGKVPRAHGRLSIPVVPPFSLVNQLSLKAFNALYARKPAKSYRTHYQPFFYPLDSIGEWNRLYGPRGFLQYQCTFPPKNGREALENLLDRISRSGQGSFLAVLKKFGDRPSPGVLSFPAPGFTIALDFPMRESRTLRLLEALDRVVEQAGGRLYPAKDARMSREAFLWSFPQYPDFQHFRDPAITSDFARRVLPPLQPAFS